jgi:hypothetical protein
MKVTVAFVYEKLAEGMDRALPALITAMFMMVIAALTTDEKEIVANFALASSICFAALAGFFIWGAMDHNRTPFWQNLAVIFFAAGFLFFIITIFAFYFEMMFG